MQERGLGDTRLLAHMQAPIGVWRSIMQNEQWSLKVLILTNSKKRPCQKKQYTCSRQFSSTCHLYNPSEIFFRYGISDFVGSNHCGKGVFGRRSVFEYAFEFEVVELAGPVLVANFRRRHARTGNPVRDVKARIMGG